jgi:hypothetical protein
MKNRKWAWPREALRSRQENTPRIPKACGADVLREQEERRIGAGSDQSLQWRGGNEIRQEIERGREPFQD